MRSFKGHLSKLFIVGTLVLLAVLGFVRISSPRTFFKSPSPASRVIRLEGYEFSSNRHPFQDGASVRAERWFLSLPGDYSDRLISATRQSNDGEPSLFCVFSLPPKTIPFHLGLVVADEMGNESDLSTPRHDLFGFNSPLWAIEVRVFPKRGRFLDLKVKERSQVLAAFRIPNPAADNYPQWKSHPVPVANVTNDLELLLTEFKSMRNKSSGWPFNSFTRLNFKVQHQGKETTSWAPERIDFSDATGNRWTPLVIHRAEFGSNEDQSMDILGALWGGEDAWKLKVEFQQRAEFRPEKLFEFEVLIPKRREIHRPYLLREGKDWRVNLMAVLGKGVPMEERYEVDPHIMGEGQLTLVFTGALDLSRASLRVLSIAYDGITYREAFGSFTIPRDVEEARSIPYVLTLNGPESEKRVKVVMAVAQHWTCEFLASLENTREGAGSAP